MIFLMIVVSLQTSEIKYKPGEKPDVLTDAVPVDASAGVAYKILPPASCISILPVFCEGMEYFTVTMLLNDDELIMFSEEPVCFFSPVAAG